jgi:hypothetical protein
MRRYWNAHPRISGFGLRSVRAGPRKRAVERARIILSRIDGKGDFSRRRERFEFWGVSGMADEQRSGKPRTYDAEFRTYVSTRTASSS